MSPAWLHLESGWPGNWLYTPVPIMCEIGNKALQQNKLIALYGFYSNYNIFVHNSL